MGKSLLMAAAAGATMLVAAGAANAAAPFDWSGLYIGAHAGYLNGDVNLNEDLSPGGGNISGFFGGVLAGYNFPHIGAPYVVGVEADVGWGDVQGNGTTCFNCAFDFHYDLEWDAHFRVRAGMNMRTYMPFIAGGVALADLNITENSKPLWNDVYTGGTIGAGFDARLEPNVVGRAEFLYDFYPKQTRDEYTASLNAWTARVAVIYRLP
jgi:outer membrane immunogenic protein